MNLPLRTCDDHGTTPNRKRGALLLSSATATGAEESLASPEWGPRTRPSVVNNAG